MIDLGNIDNTSNTNTPNAGTEDHNDYMPMNEYLSSARGFITRYGGAGKEYMLNSDDVISNIATQMMVADWKYDKNKANGRSRYSYRNQCALWTIRKIQRRYNKTVKTHQIHPDMTCDTAGATRDKIYVKEIMSSLRPAQQSILNKRYVQKMTLREVGKSIGVTKERARQIQNSIIAELRKKYRYSDES